MNQGMGCFDLLELTVLRKNTFHQKWTWHTKEHSTQHHKADPNHIFNEQIWHVSNETFNQNQPLEHDGHLIHMFALFLE